MPRPTLKKRSDGRYVCYYKDKPFYGITQTEAYNKRDEYKKQIEMGLKADAAGRTVSSYAEEWIKTYKSGVSQKTYNSYIVFIKDLLNECGDKIIQDVTTSDIQRVYNTRASNSDSDIKKLAMTVNSIFESAHADGLIIRNPCAKAKRPVGTTGTHRALEGWEKDIIKRMAKTDHRFAPAAMVMLYAGLRRGEMLALNIDRDVDFKAMTITINEAIRYDSNKPILCDPKTEAGKRTIPMLDELAAVLYGKHGLLAEMQDGGYLSETGFRRLWDSYLYNCSIMLNDGQRKRWIGKTKTDKLLLAEGEDISTWKEFKIQTHDFRHSYCTMLYEAGIDLKSAQKWMGHADEKMILKIYAHLTAKQENIAADKLRKYVLKVQNRIL